MKSDPMVEAVLEVAKAINRLALAVDGIGLNRERQELGPGCLEKIAMLLEEGLSLTVTIDKE